MKRCLLISAFFPPVGGIGVQRITKIAKYLPENGWQPVVLSAPARGLKMRKDLSMLSDLPEGLENHTPFYYDSRKIIPGDVARLYAPLENRLLFPDKFRLWNGPVKRCLKKLMKKSPADAAFINVSPFSSLHLCSWIKENLNIPVLVNFRDPFSFNQYFKMHEKTSEMKRAVKLETKAFEAADRIIFVTPYMMDCYKSRFPDFTHKMRMITNGFDEADFEGLAVKPDENGPFTIGYNGSISKIVPLKPLAEALISIYETRKISIRLSIATRNSEPELKRSFPKLFKYKLIDYRGFLPHRECLENLARAHILTLMLASSPAAEGVYTGKVFEYLRMKKPILLLSKKDSHAARLIQQTRSGTVADIDSRDEIIRAIVHYLNQWKSGRLVLSPDEEAIRAFDYRNLTARVAEEMDGAVRNFSPGAGHSISNNQEHFS
jgi:hypothetical protein